MIIIVTYNLFKIILPDATMFCTSAVLMRKMKRVRLENNHHTRSAVSSSSATTDYKSSASRSRSSLPILLVFLYFDCLFASDWVVHGRATPGWTSALLTNVYVNKLFLELQCIKFWIDCASFDILNFQCSLVNWCSLLHQGQSPSSCASGYLTKGRCLH